MVSTAASQRQRPGFDSGLECGRKLEHPEETHTDTGRMCKFHTDSDPRLELNPVPWHCEAAVLATVPPQTLLVSTGIEPATLALLAPRFNHLG